MSGEYTGQKVVVALVGEDGNAFSILGRVSRAMRKAGLGKEVIDEYNRRATAGDYNELLAVTLEYVEEPEPEDEEEDEWKDEDEEEDED